MKDLVMITNTDMSLQSGNVVLVIRRAEEIYKEFGLKTKCFILGSERNIKHKVKGISFINIKNKKEIENYIEKNKPKKIIFYGNSTFLLVPKISKLVKKYEGSVILDVQGALEELIDYEKGINFIKNYVKFFIKKKILKKALNISDGVFIVSDEMEEYCKSYLKKKKKKKIEFYKVRCGINEVISKEKKMKWRNDIRKKWGIKEKTPVMVFSGYRKPWQKIDKIIELFKKYDEELEDVFFAFFCNTDNEFEAKLKSSFKKGNYKLEFLSFENYFENLSACDIGFLIRDNNMTNKVAFPNKFSDYINAGLKLCINDALPEPIRILKKNKVDYIDLEESIFSIINKIGERQNNLLDYYNLTEKICENELRYSKQIKKINFGVIK